MDQEYLEVDNNNNKEDMIGSVLEFDKWFIDPGMTKEFKDINKDQAAANLDKVEKQAVVNCDKVISVLSALKEDGQIDQEIINIFIRKKQSILVTSLSKEGFLRTWSKTEKQVGSYSMKGFKNDKTNQYRPGFMKTKNKRGD